MFHIEISLLNKAKFYIEIPLIPFKPLFFPPKHKPIKPATVKLIVKASIILISEELKQNPAYIIQEKKKS